MEFFITKIWHIRADDKEEAQAVAQAMGPGAAITKVRNSASYKSVFNCALAYLDVKNGDYVVDLGAGEGGFFELCNSMRPGLMFSYVAVDNDPDYLDMLRMYGYKNRSADLGDEAALRSLDIRFNKCVCIMQNVVFFNAGQLNNLFAWFRSHAEAGAKIFIGIATTKCKEPIVDTVFSKFLERVSESFACYSYECEGYYCIEVTV